MDTSLKKGNNSNYEITLVITPEELLSYKGNVLESFQKQVKEPGFRDGHVPLDIVEKKVNPAYIEMWLLEEAVHAGTKQILDDNPDVKFIGNLYDLNREEKDGNTIVTFKLDVYPEIEEKNQNWKKIKMEPVESDATEEEINSTILNLSRQYADYQATEAVSEETIFKVKFDLQDENDEQIDTWSAFLGKEELEEFPWVKETFVGKKENETFTIDYDEANLPPMFHNRNKEKEGVVPAKIVATVNDIKTVVLPEFTPENIKKFFGNEEISTEEELKKKVAELMKQQKHENLLMQAVDKFLQESISSFGLYIPKTLIEEEVKTRMKSLEERMWGEEKMKEYFEKMWEEEQQKMQDDIKTAAKQSLEKFFLLKEIVEKLWIEAPDWKQAMDVEQKVYDAMTK